MSESSPGYDNKLQPEDDILYWLNELDEARKREKSFRKEGNRIIDIYQGGKIGHDYTRNSGQVPFNILYSNTDTLLPSLYSSSPRPVVQRRFKDEDPIGKAAAEASTRILEFMLDTNMEGDETINDSMYSAVFDALLPGRGVTIVKYDAEISEGDSVADFETDEAGPEMEKTGEYICTEAKDWECTLFGYAKKWSKMPWVAFEDEIDKPEAIRLFGKEIADKIKFMHASMEEDENKGMMEDEDKAGRKTALIYQIWDKTGGKKVRYVSRQYKDDFLKISDDPLELTGFFPIPKPLQFIMQAYDRPPIAPYLIYENQAKELNELTIRISRLIKAIKAKGIYDSELGGDIENLMSGDDNTFIPADKSSLLSQDRGFENAIWFMPIQEMVAVLRELYAAREQCKQVIYEVTGISDIIRGSTNANETATAQNIKSQWGTMRLKRNQQAVQNYVRDILRIALEIAATKFNEQTWASMTGLPFATEQEVQQAQSVMQAKEQYLPQLPVGEDGQPQIPEQFQGILQQAEDTLGKPQWSQVLALLKNDLQRAYHIDIETNSTVVPEAIEDQKNIADVMTALGQYLQGITPMIQEGMFPFEAAKAMMLSIVRRYQFGSDIEDKINQMTPPPQPEPPPAPPPPEPDHSVELKQMEIQAKQQSEQLAMEAETQKSQEAASLEMQKAEQQRIIEQGKAQTQMHIEQMRIDAERELEIMRILSAEKIAEMQATVSANTALEQSRINSEAMLEQVRMTQIRGLADNEKEMQMHNDHADLQAVGMQVDMMKHADIMGKQNDKTSDSQ